MSEETVEQAEAKVKSFEDKLRDEPRAKYLAEKKERGHVRTKLTMSMKRLLSELQNDPINTSLCKVILEQAEKIFADLEEKQDEIQELITDDEAALSDAEIHHFKYESHFLELKAAVLDATTTPNPVISSASVTTSSTSVLLPKASLPKFSGDSCAEYQSFISLFQSMVDSKPISKSEKLTYLKLCLEKSAKILADGYTEITDTNYDKLLAQLQTKYGLQRLVQRDHFNGIIDLPYCQLNTLPTWLNSLYSHLQSLESTGIDTEANSGFICCIVQKKLPNVLQSKYEEEIANETNFSTKRLIEFLEVKAKSQLSTQTNASDARPKTRDFPKKNFSTTSVLAVSCPMHPNNSNHKLEKCHLFINMSIEDRIQYIRKNNLCQVCFKPWSSHVKEKKCFTNCDHCYPRHENFCNHHTLVHNQKLIDSKRREKQATAVKATQGCLQGNKAVILQTCEAYIALPNGNTEKVRVFIDQGAQKSFITRNLAQKLNLQTRGYEVLSLGTFGTKNRQKPRQFQKAKITFDTYDGYENMEAIMYDGKLCCDMDAVPFIPQQKYPHLKGIKFADRYPRQQKQVDIIIGLDHSMKFMKNQIIRGNNDEPYAQRTKFGWIFFGPYKSSSNGNTMNASVNKIDVKTHNLLKSFWEIESEPTEKPLYSQKDQKILNHFEESIKFDDTTQRYEVQIPFNEKLQDLKENKEICQKICVSQENRFKYKPDLKIGITKVFNTLKEEGVIQKVNEKEKSKNQCHYIPWHSVIRQNHPTTPIRIVNNASKKDENGLSLNDCQATGPNLYPDLQGLLINWRRYHIAVICDISKMFLQLQIPVEQQDLHRFFIKSDLNELLEIWKYTRVLFGSTSSPFLAIAASRYHAKSEKMQKECPLAVKMVLSGELYMDDSITGAATKEQALELYQQIVKFFKSMNMNVHKFNSNDESFLSEIPEHQKSQEKKIDTVLGVQWNTESDTISVKYKQPHNENAKITKRVILGAVASFYDPLGIHSPLITRGKMILQKCWSDKIDWDEKVSSELENEFACWLSSATINLELPRKYSTTEFESAVKILHTFVDASKDAYAIVILLQINTDISFVISKSRVAPLKVQTIPRLELMAATLGSTLTKFVKTTLNIQKIETNFWTDSKIVLDWIQAEPHLMKTFVANRVVQIQTTTALQEWKWIPGDQNPADIPSRGIWPLDEEKRKLYLEGPEWLLSKSQWPEQPSKGTPLEEMRSSKVSVNICTSSEILIDVARFSNLQKLLNTVSYVFRFIAKRGERGWPSPTPTPEENEKSLQYIIKAHQMKHFSEEYESLQNGKPIKPKSKLISLTPIFKDGIIRIGGRIQDADLSEESKHPIILEPNDPFTKMIITHTHKINLHVGVSQTLSEIRKKYWILRGMQNIKKIVKKCTVCQKIAKKAMEQIMAPLPEFRITKAPAFSHVGIDFAGPLMVKEKLVVNKQAKEKPKKKDQQEEVIYKVWIVLFTCAVTRAIHLELVRSQSTEDFIAAFTRFTSRRGQPTNIYSDNAKQFKRAEKELTKLFDLLTDQKFTTHLTSKNIKWTFNPPYAAHWGAFWERMVKSVKIPLKKVLGNALCTEPELYTVLCQIERIINSRPLTAITDESGIIPLTPAMILIGRNYDSYPKAPPPRGDEIVQRWRYRQELESSFWNRWQKEYLPLLQQRSKWQKKQQELKNDDVVLLVNQDKRQKWPLGLVKEVHKGRDGLVRSATIKSDNKLIRRAINQMVKLELDEE